VRDELSGHSALGMSEDVQWNIHPVPGWSSKRTRSQRRFDKIPFRFLSTKLLTTLEVICATRSASLGPRLGQIFWPPYAPTSAECIVGHLTTMGKCNACS
jgi:hypothetical protein